LVSALAFALALASLLLLLGMRPAGAAEGAAARPPAEAAAPASPEPEPPPEPWWTANKFHRYTGLGAIALGAAAALTAPDDEGDEGGAGRSGEDEGFHHNAAVAATALAVLAAGSGLVLHWEDIDLSAGWGDPDNLHAALGLLGTAGFATAVAQAPRSGHAGAGLLGGLAMLVAVKLEW
ncbi:MAG: hypothetical protein D6809_01785, partial [Gammaproteobacteria bacterium]